MVMDGLLEVVIYVVLVVVCEDGMLLVMWVVFFVDKDRVFVILIFDLFLYIKVLCSGWVCFLLIGESGDKGDLLMYLRLMLYCLL